MTAKEKAHALQVLLRGSFNETYGGIIIFNNNMTYRLVPEQEHKEYDHTGAAYYVVAVVLVYGLSIILLIASHIKRKHKKFVEDRQINRYLQAAPSLKEKSAKARWKELKMSFIPITLATVAIGNSISPSEKHQLTTVSEETDDEVQELEAITIDTGYGNRHISTENETDDCDEESICLLNDTCDSTDDELLAELTDCLSDGEGYIDSGIGNTSSEKQLYISPENRDEIFYTEASKIDRPTHIELNRSKHIVNNGLHNNDNNDVFIAIRSPGQNKQNHKHELPWKYSPRKTFLESPTHVPGPDSASHKSPVYYMDNCNERESGEEDTSSDMTGEDMITCMVGEDTWVKRSSLTETQEEQDSEISRETQL